VGKKSGRHFRVCHTLQLKDNLEAKLNIDHEEKQVIFWDRKAKGPTESIPIKIATWRKLFVWNTKKNLSIRASCEAILVPF
jgi:hypothetical protein